MNGSSRAFRFVLNGLKPGGGQRSRSLGSQGQRSIPPNPGGRWTLSSSSTKAIGTALVTGSAIYLGWKLINPHGPVYALKPRNKVINFKNVLKIYLRVYLKNDFLSERYL